MPHANIFFERIRSGLQQAIATINKAKRQAKAALDKNSPQILRRLARNNGPQPIKHVSDSHVQVQIHLKYYRFSNQI